MKHWFECELTRSPSLQVKTEGNRLLECMLLKVKMKLSQTTQETEFSTKENIQGNIIHPKLIS